MRKKFVISRLEEIAFTACYREIISNLLLCPEHSQSHSVSMNTYSSLISLNSFLTSSNVREFVRSRLDYHLIGIMNDEIRKKLVCEFNKNFYKSDQIMDVWVFLDCVLDNSFTELETHVCPLTEPNKKFFHSIFYRSPGMKVLKLNFETVGKSTVKDKLYPIISSLTSLTNLTSLSLYHLNKCHRGLLKCIGISCPRLHHICITGFCFLKEDILALILGESLNQFPDREMSEDENDGVSLEIPLEFLKPFCSTLQHLQLEDLEEKEKLKKRCEFSGLDPASVALLLRHMPNLTRIDHSSSSVSSAVKLLHQIPNTNENSLTGSIISLTSIDFLNIRDEMMMKAVGRMCPHLKEVTFSGILRTDAIITPDQLFSIVTTEWPKVERITLIKVSTSYCRAILQGIGSQLSQLTFANCELIDVADLTLCTELEVLRFYFSSSLLLPTENPEEKYFPSVPFLPKLYRLESDICLRSRYSHLFEEKQTLTYLDLECSHVCTKASDIWNWHDITEYWQQIQTLHIRNCSSLTITGAKNLAFKLTKLKELSLPSRMLSSKDERKISYDLMDYFNKEPLKIRLNYERSKSSSCCPYQIPEYSYYETSDEEIISGNSDKWSRESNGAGFAANDVYDDWSEESHVSVDDWF